MTPDSTRPHSPEISAVPSATAPATQDGEFCINVPPEAERSRPSTPRIPGWKSWMQLLRLPALLTAWADIFLGYLLTHNPWGLSGSEFRGELPIFGLLLLASSGLYLAGMVWNDYFDFAIDQKERPERPLPSGRISPQAAFRAGVFLVILGINSAASIGTISTALWHWNPLWIALLITIAMFSYDGLLKGTVIGPVNMGLCRFFNVLLGASCSGIRWTGPFQMPQLWIAAGLAVYVCGVTWFARTEASISSRRSLAGAMCVVNAGLAILLSWVWNGIIAVDPQHATLLIGIIALTINRHLIVALISPTPQRVQQGVRMMLLSIIPLDCALIYTHHNRIEFATLLAIALLLPTFTLGRLVRVT